MQGIADEKAAAKADARAATASARETGLGSERDKAFEALKQENERLRDALTSVMRQVKAVVVAAAAAAAAITQRLAGRTAPTRYTVEAVVECISVWVVRVLASRPV